ncbi:MAG TPA: AAA family ATPase, partial [Gemmataceae bacterium]|nr:AAA family ATPase [Gemmataceae bacterium]
LTNSHFRDRNALLQAILFDLSLPFEHRGEQEMRIVLTEYLLRHFAEERRPVVLIVDEAHHLDADLLEELRLLANLEAPNGRALQIVLVAQPAILETLARPEMTALRQRLAVRGELGPLSLEESADFLLHHLRSAGARPEEVFADDAVEMLARGTLGVARLLNQAAHRALTLAVAADVEVVDVEAALEALALLGLEAQIPADPAAETEHEAVFPRIGDAAAVLRG